jgi:hypothetical protein
MESIPIGMVVAARLESQADTNDRGHKTRNRSAPALNYFKRRFVALIRYVFCAATRDKFDRQKVADNVSQSDDLTE